MTQTQTYTGERVIPHDSQAELAVVGSLLIDPEAVHRIMGKIEARDFYEAKAARVWEAVTELWTQGTPTDQVVVARTLVMMLGPQGFEAIGGMAYLAHTVAVTPTSVHIEYYVMLVKEASRQRALINVGGGLMGSAYDLQPSEQLIDDAMNRLIDLKDRGRDRAPQSLREIYDEYQAELVEEFHGEQDQTVGVSTGFRLLDRMINGFQNGLLYVMCSRTSMGKTLTSNAIALSMARRGHPVFIFSLELPRKTLIRRMIFTEARVSNDQLKGMASGAERDKNIDHCIDAMNEIEQMPIFIDDRAGITPTDMRATLSAHIQTRGKPALVILDYLNIMNADSRARTAYEAMSSMIKEVKIIGSELEVPILCLAQLNRQPDSRPDRDRRPTMSDLRDAGTIEEVANCIMGLYRRSYYYDREEWARDFPQDQYPEHLLDIDIMKQQEGPTGTVSLYVDLPTGFLGDLAQVTQPDSWEVR